MQVKRDGSERVRVMECGGEPRPAVGQKLGAWSLAWGGEGSLASQGLGAQHEPPGF